MIRHLLKQADIIWVDFGEVKDAVGHEQAKTRPCIVIKDFNKLQMAIVLPLSTKEKSFYKVVKIEKVETGLSVDSYALCHQLRTISYDRIKGKSGTLSQRAFFKIKGVLVDILELS